MIKILVIGEVCIDKFIYGETKRLSPEAPVPVFEPIKIIENKGMAGNVIENLKSIDKDLEIIEWTQQESITKTRYIEKYSNHMFLRVDEGEQNLSSKLDNLNEEIIKNSDIVIVSDYNKGFLSLDIIKNIGDLANLSILDSKKKLDDETLSKYKFVKLNKDEYINNNHLKNKTNLIVTLGCDGAMYNNKIYKSPNPSETIDVSGAGDTFVAAFILNYYKTKNIKKSIQFANKMSSIVVNKRGVTVPIN
jgi:D-beta-D-heptose 7-phosphate kinase/D-beta-D-heptose 1-phosphate adenosyltransferase